MNKTLAHATQVDDRHISILVDADSSWSLYEFLRSHVQCLPPSAEIRRGRRAYLDANGERQVEPETTLNELIVTGSLNDFEKWIVQWTPVPQK